jgi:hypothetical protein
MSGQRRPRHGTGGLREAPWRRPRRGACERHGAPRRPPRCGEWRGHFGGDLDVEPQGSVGSVWSPWRRWFSLESMGGVLAQRGPEAIGEMHKKRGVHF